MATRARTGAVPRLSPLNAPHEPLATDRGARAVRLARVEQQGHPLPRELPTRRAVVVRRAEWLLLVLTLPVGAFGVWAWLNLPALLGWGCS